MDIGDRLKLADYDTRASATGVSTGHQLVVLNNNSNAFIVAALVSSEQEETLENHAILTAIFYYQHQDEADRAYAAALATMMMEAMTR
jgi:hypothetical protein